MNSLLKQRLPLIRKVYIRIKLYVNYPDTFRNDVQLIRHWPKAKKLGIRFARPNLMYKDNFSQGSIVIDIGCGYEADLSVGLINKFNVKAYAIDPTDKHRAKLSEIEQKYPGQFIHLAYAVAPEPGKILFKESAQHESGSLLNSHINVLHDDIREYEVEAITISQIPALVNSQQIDLIKIDIEGIEYDLLKDIDMADFDPFRQIFIEFHHHAVEGISKADTLKIVQKFRDAGYQSFTYDTNNYLFFKNRENEGKSHS